MDEAWFDRLDSTADEPAELFEHFREREFEGRTYHALSDTRHGVERGTVVLGDGTVVRGYPSVARVLALDAGLRSVFDPDETIHVEEKLDGFNVRIVRVDTADEANGDAEAADGTTVLAFTRGGHVCPYTTALARERLETAAFFDDHPGRMLCAELVGPETPYTTHDYDGIETNAFRVFGVRERAAGVPLPVAERRDLCDRYGFAQPRLFGSAEPAAAVEVVREAIADLDAAGREGVVLKAADGRSMVKYTTEAQHHDELAYAFSLPFDLGQDFVFSRIVREAFQAAEFDEDDERVRERAHDLGESILLPFVETIHDVASDEPVGERHTVRGDPDTVEALLYHLGQQGLSVEITDDRWEDGERVVEFVKAAAATRDRVEYYLEGGTYDE
ncbi:RNA ligase [Haloglomus halophilum]|uniref:RNA ligase n=1 Tax=Haloglomus halophilum TaxID=2962672 RepID=UPI0020C97ED3|nr:RNA ligase [Haloglomus halophilum]